MAGLTADPRGVLISCPHCEQTNRLKYDALDRETRCGSCHTTLEKAAAPVAIADIAAFDEMLRHASLPIVVDFWAPWCGPCRMMAPEFEKVARATAGAWLVAKVDTEQVPELGERYRIRSIPTLAIFRSGKEVARRSGAMPATDIQRFMSTSA